MGPCSCPATQSPCSTPGGGGGGGGREGGREGDGSIEIHVSEGMKRDI